MYPDYETEIMDYTRRLPGLLHRQGTLQTIYYLQEQVRILVEHQEKQDKRIGGSRRSVWLAGLAREVSAM